MLPKEMAEALSSIVKELDEHKIEYMIIGSVAACLHGAIMTKPPSDVDILVTDYRKARVLFNSTNLAKVAINRNGVDFEIINNSDGDFGIPQKWAMELHLDSSNISVWVSNLYETIRSLILRPGVREKEKEAINSLMKSKGDSLGCEKCEQIALLFESKFCRGSSASSKKVEDEEEIVAQSPVASSSSSKKI